MTAPRLNDTALNSFADDLQAIARIEAVLANRPMTGQRHPRSTAGRVLGALRMFRH